MRALPIGHALRAVARVVLVACLPLAMLPRHVLADGGWSTPMALSTGGEDVIGSGVAVDAHARVHGVWSQDGEIYHRVKVGGRWSAPERVASGHSPHIAPDSAGRVHLAFVRRSGDSDDVFYVSWRAGEGWDLPVNVSETDTASVAPALAFASAGTLMMAWSETVTDTELIYQAESADGYLWASAPIPHAEGSSPAIAVDSSDVTWVAWEDVFDEGFPLEVFAARSQGAGWDLPVDVSYSPLATSSMPALATGPGGPVLAWEEAGDAGSTAIVTSVMTDTFWSGPRSRSGDANASAPALAFDAVGKGHLVLSTPDGVEHIAWDPSSDVWGARETIVEQGNSGEVAMAADVAVHVVWVADDGGRRVLYYATNADAPDAGWALYLPLVTR